MKTIKVPITKNQTGDASDKYKYRPISLATVIDKVFLIRLKWLDKHFSKHLDFTKRILGFSPNSTETMIVCLKHATPAEKHRSMHVLVLIKSFRPGFWWNFVTKALKTDTIITKDLIHAFKFWYEKQNNNVRWPNFYSDTHTGWIAVWGMMDNFTKA